MEWSMRGDRTINGRSTGERYCSTQLQPTSRVRVSSNMNMSHCGGAATMLWLFLPYISCRQVIDRHTLQGLEQNPIGLYPSALNRIRHPTSLYRPMPKGGQAPVEVDLASHVHAEGRKGPANCGVETRVHIADADGAVLCGFELNGAIRTCAAVTWHSSYPWTTTQSTCWFGGLTVIMYDHW